MGGVVFTSVGALKTSELDVIDDLAAQINANSATQAVVFASRSSEAMYKEPALKISLRDPATWLDYGLATNLTRDGGNPSPIRFAEVRVTGSGGDLIQCAETDVTGHFEFLLPKSNNVYTVHVTSRSSNLHNTAFVLSDPQENGFYPDLSACYRNGFAYRSESDPFDRKSDRKS